MKPLNLIGERFGRLVVIEKVTNNKSGYTYFLCGCDCGTKKEIRAGSLTQKKNPVRSCGCLTRERASEALKIEYGLSTKKAIYWSYKAIAKKRNLSFELSFEQFLELTRQNCWYCRTKPNNCEKSKSNNGDFLYQGIDRKCNEIGYTLENCTPCCKICNIAKGKMSVDEFLEWIEKVHMNFKG